VPSCRKASLLLVASIKREREKRKQLAIQKPSHHYQHYHRLSRATRSRTLVFVLPSVSLASSPVSISQHDKLTLSSPLNHQPLSLNLK